jgi:transposase-like protein
MVERLTGPHSMSASALSVETGVAQSTLSRWLKGAATVEPKMARRDKQKKDSSSSERRPQDWTAEEKLALVLEAAALSADELGAFLRQKGVHEAQLAEWRQQVTQGAVAALRGPTKADRKAANIEKERIRKLEREVARKDKALAEAAALLVLKKKAQSIWGDEDDDTDPENDE